MNPFAVAVINYNTRDLLRDCLQTVLQNAPAEVVVVDNVSADGSAAMVRAEFPSVTLIENTVNRGYGAASNQAMAACQTPYFLLLNSDTLLPPAALEALSAYLDGHPEAGIAGPRLRNADGSLQPSCFPFPTPQDVFLDASHLSVLARKLPALRERYLRAWPHDRARVVPWVIRRSGGHPQARFRAGKRF